MDTDLPTGCAEMNNQCLPTGGVEVNVPLTGEVLQPGMATGDTENYELQAEDLLRPGLPTGGAEVNIPLVGGGYCKQRICRSRVCLQVVLR